MSKKEKDIAFPLVLARAAVLAAGGKLRKA